jgi:hypothetical protein
MHPLHERHHVRVPTSESSGLVLPIIVSPPRGHELEKESSVGAAATGSVG